jgi:hypothetical protein
VSSVRAPRRCWRQVLLVEAQAVLKPGMADVVRTVSRADGLVVGRRETRNAWAERGVDAVALKCDRGAGTIGQRAAGVTALGCGSA